MSNNKKRRWDFWGNEIRNKQKTFKKITEEEIEEKEFRKSSFDYLWILLSLCIIPILLIVVLAVTNGIIDDISIDGFYTIRIYIPNCDNGELIFVEYGVSGQYLFDNNLGERKGLFDNDLKPVSDFQIWEQYVIKETGKAIPDNNCCVSFIKE